MDGPSPITVAGNIKSCISLLCPTTSRPTTRDLADRICLTEKLSIRRTKYVSSELSASSCGTHVLPQTEESAFRCGVNGCGYRLVNGYEADDHYWSCHQDAIDFFDDDGDRKCASLSIQSSNVHLTTCRFRCLFPPCTHAARSRTRLAFHHNLHLGILPQECPHVLSKFPHPTQPSFTVYVPCPARFADAEGLSHHCRKSHEYKRTEERVVGNAARGKRVLDGSIWAPEYTAQRKQRKEAAWRAYREKCIRRRRDDPALDVPEGRPLLNVGGPQQPWAPLGLVSYACTPQHGPYVAPAPYPLAPLVPVAPSAGFMNTPPQLQLPAIYGPGMLPGHQTPSYPPTFWPAQVYPAPYGHLHLPPQVSRHPVPVYAMPYFPHQVNSSQSHPYQFVPQIQVTNTDGVCSPLDNGSIRSAPLPHPPSPAPTSHE